ncbi:MAG: SCO1664 family protein [Actinobacteria bacterium]|nr:SCO1664 family protein [Actinomycetota bacterium]NCX78553.1 SCO1664 family protein [Actinomycetota bacterium]NCZ88633.1 SCO1664 family protein [Actinomycetota bacterium]NDD18053.1 SCO1664 family protein [Acidimicrobiia bacterium]NDI15210.1 SCO1664 family protein [Actinomycetota bacterium]
MPANELTAAEILATGEINVEMRMPYSSNATFLVRVTAGEQSLRAIYKPLRGERPLWDFAPGLHRREVAAYRLATAMGLGFVPITLLRDGPIGEGSLQRLIDADFEQHYFTLHEQRPDLHPKLREVAVFDILANNTDRKSGHVLIDTDDNIWGIDHGLCFSADFKLRTVIWEFGGEEIDDSLIAAVERVAGSLPLDVSSLLDDDEVVALGERAAWLLEHRRLPVDPTGRRYPWPLV